MRNDIKPKRTVIKSQKIGLVNIKSQYAYYTDKDVIIERTDKVLCVKIPNINRLEEIVDPEKFFRINRKFPVNRNAIEDIFSYSASKLKLKIKHIRNEYLTVSRNRLDK